jgi:hypothetical protein
MKDNYHLQQKLSDCGCCGTGDDVDTLEKKNWKITPNVIENRPGLFDLRYRIGTHSRFKASMITKLRTEDLIRGLTASADDDLTIAVLDSWATVADVITFYQERIANEGFLRTAKERLSILELARTIGYEVGPGVAANTNLVFTLEDAPGVVEKAIIDVGTKVQSLPADGEMPQIFETIERIEAIPELNEIKPKLTIPQEIDGNNPELYFDGINTDLKPGDGLLIAILTTEKKEEPKVFRIVSKVDLEPLVQRTRVEVIVDPHIDPPTILADVIVYSFRLRTGFFGDLAPRYASLHPTLTNSPGADWWNKHLNWDDRDHLFTINHRSTVPKNPLEFDKDPYAYDPSGQNLIYLDNVYPTIVPGSWIVLKSVNKIWNNWVLPLKIMSTREETMTEFGLTAKVTGLTLSLANKTDLSTFYLKETTAFVQSEKLSLAEIPNPSVAMKANDIKLDREVKGIREGQLISVTGKLLTIKEKDTGLTESEFATVSRFNNSEISFVENLRNMYRTDSVIMRANVVRATHGDTKKEILGSGDASQGEQEFILKQKPLTYISAPTPRGVKGTLKIWVDDVTCKEIDSLYYLKHDDLCYTLRLDDDGTAHIAFGDGIRGMRLPSGLENVRAEYRVGTGINGMVKKDQINLLMSRPLGVRSVTNPCAPTGAANPQDKECARESAPLTVLTMDRIVSLLDFENFAKGFAAVGKAQAIWIWDGERKKVHLTVASANGDILDKDSDSDSYGNLVEAINKCKDPMIRFDIESFNKKTFDLSANILVAEGKEAPKVLSKIRETLTFKFSFQSRDFGQYVSMSEVEAAIQDVDGVEALNMEYLCLSDEKKVKTECKSPIPSSMARWDDIKGRVIPAELLIINPEGINLGVMSSK